MINFVYFMITSLIVQVCIDIVDKYCLNIKTCMPCSDV